jgi:hypothetical protein
MKKQFVAPSLVPGARLGEITHGAVSQLVPD